MTETKRPLRVFLCHASGDKPAVIKLYEQLVNDGVDAWLDKEKLIPGQDWQVEIPKAVKHSDVVIVCLSSQSVTKEGFVQKEIKIALDAADEKPDGTIFIIPARLENCEVPERIGRFHWVDLFSDDGYERLIKALQIRANNLGITFKRRKKPVKTITEDYMNIDDSPNGTDAPQDDSSKTNEPKKPPLAEVAQFEKQKSFFVAFADEKKANSATKLMVFNDIGTFKIEKHFIKFNGIRSNLAFSFDSQISIAKQKLPWVGFFLSNVFSVVLLIAAYYLFFYNTTTKEIAIPTSVTIFLAVLFGSLLILSNIFAIAISYITKWVKIDYTDKNGVRHSAYFSDASFLGYSGFFGGTEKIYRALNAQKMYLSTYRA